MLCVLIRMPHPGNSNKYTSHAIINIKKKIRLNYPKYNNVCSYGIFFLGTQKQNSRGKRAISVGSIEVLLYLVLIKPGTLLLHSPLFPLVLPLSPRESSHAT